MSAGRATGKGEMLCLECLAIKVKFPWATVFTHDQSFAGAEGQVEARL